MRFLKRHKLAIILIFIILFVYFSQIRLADQKLSELKAQQTLLKEELRELNEEFLRLRDELEFSKSPEQIEKIAREKLKMVKPNEIIYLIKPQE